jgi:hypothetical protein
VECVHAKCRKTHKQKRVSTTYASQPDNLFSSKKSTLISK